MWSDYGDLGCTQIRISGRDSLPQAWVAYVEYESGFCWTHCIPGFGENIHSFSTLLVGIGQTQRLPALTIIFTTHVKDFTHTEGLDV